MSLRKKSSNPLFFGMRHRVKILWIVVASIALLVALFFFAMSIKAFQPQQGRLIVAGAYFAGLSGLLFVLYLLTFVAPDALRRRRSPSFKQRLEEENHRRERLEKADRAAQKRGGVLVLLLILTGLIAALLAQSHALTRARTIERQAAQEHTQLRQAATEAARLALQRLADDPDLTVDALSEDWAVEQTEQTPLGIQTQVSVRDEQAFFDLNNLAAPNSPGRRASEDIAMDLQTLCGDFAPSAKTSALRDFVDEDTDGARETDFYRRLVPPATCPNRALYGWREILHVDGWSEEQLARRPRASAMDGFNASLIDHATLIPVARTRPIPINVNTASRETLRAVMGIEQDALVDTVLVLREIHPIRQLDVFSITAGPETFDRLQPFLDVRSHYFRIRARAERDGRRAAVETLVKREDDGRVLVLQWVEEPS